MFPKVTISEFIDGPLAVPLRTLNRVACVGTSKKGKYKSFILVSTDTDLDNKIGRDTSTGSVGLQCARSEGASDTAFVRVMGAARSASGSFKLAVTAGATAVTTAAETLTLAIDPDSSAAGSVQTYNIDIPVGSSALAASYLVIAELAADPNVTAKYNAATKEITLTAKQTGLSTNFISWSLTQAAGSEFTVTSATGNLSGGFDGPVQATRTVGDLQLICAYEGVFGNTIQISFIPGATATQVTLTLKDGDNVTESFTLDFVPSSLINGNEFAVLRGSSMVRGFFNPSGTITSPVLPTNTLRGANAFMQGGSDGAPIVDQDYIEALILLGRNQANIVFVPGQTAAAIKSALIEQATKSTILTGLRISILNGPRLPDTGAAETGTYTEGLDIGSADYGGAAVMVLGWSTYSGQTSLPELSVSPDGFYAGHLARTAAYVSPAARSSSPYFSSVVATDTDNTDVAFEAYTKGRLEAIVLDPATGGYHCLNGRTLSSSSAHYYVSVRRMANQIKTDIWFASQPLKSEPNSGGVITSLTAMVSSYLSNKAAIGQIKDFSILSAASTGTNIRIDFQWYPVYPADQIDYGMHRLAVAV